MQDEATDAPLPSSALLAVRQELRRSAEGQSLIVDRSAFSFDESLIERLAEPIAQRLLDVLTEFDVARTAAVSELVGTLAVHASLQQGTGGRVAIEDYPNRPQ